MPLRFEADFSDPSEIDFEPYIDEVFGELKSTFLTMPRGEGFLDYPTFEAGYEVLKKATAGFVNVTQEILTKTAYQTPVAFVVIRTILGFTPPEWAYVTTERGAVTVDQGAARTLDRKMRLLGLKPLIDKNSVTDNRIKAMLAAAVALLEDGAGDIDRTLVVHRLDKFDTSDGIRSIRPAADLGVP